MMSIMTRALAIFALLMTLASGSFAFAADAPRKEAAQTPPDYVIGPEDVLDVAVWKNPDLSRVVTVRPDGMISLPLIGDIKAAGLTPTQLRDSIVSKLKDYQETATASVIVQAVNSYRIYILGEVRAPGTYLLKSKTTILQAISMAGGFTQYASENSIVLIRHNSLTGAEEKHDIRFKDLVYSKGSKNDKILMPGDTIFVP